MRATGRKLPISTVAERYGVPASTLRYWEQIGLLPVQQRTAGQRRYDLDAIRRIEECLACGCQHARRCKLLTMSSPGRCTE